MSRKSILPSIFVLFAVFQAHASGPIRYNKLPEGFDYKYVCVLDVHERCEIRGSAQNHCNRFKKEFTITEKEAGEVLKMHSPVLNSDFTVTGNGWDLVALDQKPYISSVDLTFYRPFLHTKMYAPGNVSTSVEIEVRILPESGANFLKTRGYGSLLSREMRAYTRVDVLNDGKNDKPNEYYTGTKSGQDSYEVKLFCKVEYSDGSEGEI